MQAVQSFLKVFKSKKMAAILLLGFASGLPFALTDDAFRAWMTKANLSLSTIGWFSWVALPYSFKFVWAPFLDRYIPPILGRRRGWIVIAQLSLLVAILAIASQMATIANLPVEQRGFNLQLLAFTALVVAFLSATQDISIDAYRADVLKPNETGAGASLGILGYRIALLLTGWIAFNLADHITWHWVYALMALLMGIGLFTSFWAPESHHGDRSPTSLAEAVISPFSEFLHRFGWQRALFTLLFIILFKLGDAMVTKMAIPFLGGKGLGFSDSDIGNIRQGLGLFATIVGTLAGGAILSKIGIQRSLWVFGGLQAFSNLGYYALAIIGKNYTAMVLAINLENFCGGLGTAGFVGFLISLCNPRFSATQFALLSSLMAVGRDLLAGPASGGLAQKLPSFLSPDTTIFLAGVDHRGWPLFFLITLLATLPGLLLLPFFAPWTAQSASGQDFSLDDEDL